VLATPRPAGLAFALILIDWPMPYEIETIRFNSAHLGDDMLQRQRSLRLTRVFERLSKRKRAAKQAAKEARDATKLADQQQDKAQPDAAAEDESQD
jgi:hypothetical protein